jgi:hypothetical protein
MSTVLEIVEEEIIKAQKRIEKLVLETPTDSEEMDLLHKVTMLKMGFILGVGKPKK